MSGFWKTSLSLLVVLGVSFAPGISALGSDLPSVLSFQGRVSVENVPFNGAGQFKFALVNADQRLAWTSAPDLNPADGEPDQGIAIAVTQGHYSVLLGEGMATLPPGLFTKTQSPKLRVWFDDGSRGFHLLGPDIDLPTVAQAHRSVSSDSTVRADVAELADTATRMVENPGLSGDSTFMGAVGIGTPPSLTALLQVDGPVRTERLALHQSFVTMWGQDEPAFGPIASKLGDVVKLALAPQHGLALRRDGTVFEWGTNIYHWTPTPPAGLRDVVAIAVGPLHSLAVKSDGTVVAWGLEDTRLVKVPPGLDHVVAVACGYFHNLALKSDGTVVAWGFDYLGQISVPANLRNVVAIAAGGEHSLALKSDGTVVTWGSNVNGMNVPPPGLNQVVAIACASFFNVALKADGTVVSWGDDPSGRGTVPPGINNVAAIACGYFHSVALRRDGTVTTWGGNAFGETSDPSKLDHVVGLAAGGLTSGVIRAADLDNLASSSTHPHFSAGLSATASGSQIAIQASTTDSSGWAGYFEGRTYLASPVGIGNTQPVASLDILGQAYVTANKPSGGMIVAGQLAPIALTLRAGSQERGALGMAHEADQFSTDAESGDLVLRTTTSANQLLLQNGGGSAAAVVRNQRLGVGVLDPDAPVSLRRDTANPEFGYCLALNDRDGTPLWKLGVDNNRHFSIGAAGLRDRDIAINRTNGDVRVSKSLYVDGAVNAAGFQQTSDVRRKTEIAPLTDALAHLEGLRGVSFSWKQDVNAAPATATVMETGTRQLGFLAQEVAGVLPEVVHTNADGFLSMNYSGVTPVLVEGVKELKHNATTRLARAQEDLAAIEERLARLEEKAAQRRTVRHHP
ncbi:MAG: tail fiber domain-containing protein [Verrucomicrobiales bacterium]|nr:tail fiber domain-containing protein [Verrucomicrobiales bacterium]